MPTYTYLRCYITLLIPDANFKAYIHMGETPVLVTS